MRRVHLFFLLLPLFGACSTGTDPGPCEEVGCRPVNYLLAISMECYSFPDSPLCARHIFADYVQHGYFADRFFESSFSRTWEMGTVALNGERLTQREFGFNGPVYMFDTPRPDSVVAAPGDTNYWFVQEISDKLPSGARLSIPTPTSFPAITALFSGTGDTIAAGSDLTIIRPIGESQDQERTHLTLAMSADSSGEMGFPHIDRQFFSDWEFDSPSLTLPADSLRTWGRDFDVITVMLRHSRFRDIPLATHEGVRLLFSEVTYRRFYLP